MDIETIRRLNLARHLYELGTASLRSANDIHLFSAVNLMQDAVEAFLIAVSDHVGAVIDSNTKFDRYFVLINERIAPKQLPFTTKLVRLNRVRVDSKHYGIQPSRDECERIAVSVREFFDEVCATILGASFSSVSAIDLLKEGETRMVLLDAKQALEVGELEECAINCRKALYLEIERSYDISAFKDGEPINFFRSFSEAPLFAKSKQYIDENVLDPTDFVVYDHASLNQRLLIQGVDNTSYWNVWRLTPEVCLTEDKKWVIKHDFAKLDPVVLKDKIEYIFSATLDVILSIHRKAQAAVWAQPGRYKAKLTQRGVTIYKKADKQSEIAGYTPADMSEIETDYRVDGLNGDGPYWHVCDVERGFPPLWGFIHNDSVE